MAFESSIQFYIPTRIHFEVESLDSLSKTLQPWGTRVVIVTVRSEITDHALLHEIRALLERDFNTVILYDDIEHQPDSDDLDSAAYFIRQTDCDIILGVGGLESMNVAKTLAMLIRNDGFCSEYLAGNKKPVNPPITCITMPFYPVYGNEIVPSIRLIDAEDRIKKIVFHDTFFPTMAYIDPSFALNIQSELTTASGVAIIAAAVETLLGRTSNDITNTFSLKSVEMAFKALPRLMADSKAMNQRSNLALASILVGLGYANSALGTVFAIAMAVNGMTGVAEDLLMGILLPHVMEYNLTASPGKYVQLVKILDGVEVKEITVIEAAIKAVESIRKLYLELSLPSRISDLGLQKGDFSEFARIASSYSFLEYTPRPLNQDEIETLLIAAY